MRTASEIAREINQENECHNGGVIIHAAITARQLRIALHEVWVQACTDAYSRCDDYVQAICRKIGTTKGEAQAAIDCRDRVITVRDSKKPSDF